MGEREQSAAAKREDREERQKVTREVWKWISAVLFSFVLTMGGYIVNDVVDGGAIREHETGGPHPEATVLFAGLQRDMEKLVIALERELDKADLDRAAMKRELSQLNAAFNRLEGALRAKGLVP